jgi:amino acid adenylation domain-containing protein
LAYFYRELAVFYEAALVGSAVSLPRLPVQFADYASWQQRWLGGAPAKAQLAYWQRQLNNPPPPLDLAADYERPVRSSYRGARTSKRLSLELTRALNDLSRREGVTLFMTLLAGLSILLGRLAGRDDFVIGSTIAGRNRPELEGAIGFFINALALRCDLSGGPNFTELLKRVREACLDAYAHQDLPFDKVVEALNPGRDLGRNPLFEVMFNMNEVSARALKLKDCRTEKLIQSEPSAKFDITLYAPEVEGAIELVMVYNADLFGPARVAIYLDQLSAVLEQAATAPGKNIELFSLLTPSTEALLPDPVAPLGDLWFGAVHETISRQAQTGPQRLALTDATGDWRYRELDLQSNQLAHYFLDRGLRPRDVIAIHAQRSASLVVALLGVLKAGAVFVVLDPAYPAARLIDYLSIAQPKAWVQLEPAGKLPQTLAQYLGSAGLRCRLNLPPAKNEIASLLVGYSGKPPEIVLGADDPAYIAFTSGSTGQPKGVLCRHGPVSHFLPWQEAVFALRNRDRYSLLSGLGYNHLQREIFTALASGARLYVPSAAQVQSPTLLTSWLRDRKISILHLTPALGRMIQTAGAAPLPSLRRIFFGGDVLTRHDVAAMGRLAPMAKIVSFYGATETQRAVGFFRVDEDEPKTGTGEYSAVPTGRGAPDVQLLLLTRGARLAGVGELGDLYVRSPHLAAGYVCDEESTKLNFLTNPFTGDPRDRLYRSGEFGRYRPDGNVEWVGRRDRRASIRGFRVEVAEIESALMQHPAVRAAAVAETSQLKIKTSKLSEQLIAYVVSDDSARILVTELRAFLAARLPHYMVPADFIFLDRLPMSPNGKVDYSMLPVSNRQRNAQTSWQAPRSAIEQRLAAMVAEILGVEKVGRRDDFFRLGGHSLLAAQLTARVRERLGVGLELRTFLEAPTVEALAKRVEAMGGSPCIELGREEIEL